MRRISWILACFLIFALAGCGTPASDITDLTESYRQTETNDTHPETVSEQETEVSAATEPTEDINVKQNVFYITAGDTVLTANFADSAAADSLKELLRGGDITVSMSDYGGWEKVGSLGQSLNRNDMQITASVGDIMLYQGSQIVIFYDKNSWNYSRLGKIQNATKKALISAFGTGDTEITLSMTK